MLKNQRQSLKLARAIIKQVAIISLCVAVLFYMLLFYSIDSSENSQMTIVSLPTFTKSQLQLMSVDRLFQQPAHYPWNIHTTSPDDKGKWNFDLLYKVAYNPDPKFVLTQLYNVRHGKLYGWKPQQKLVRQHEFYNLRVQRYEQLLARSLSVARDACAHYKQKIDPRVKELVTEPFFFNFEWMDFTTCRPWHKGMPFFAFLTFPHQNPNETCTPLATPTYEQWRKYQDIENSSHWDVVFQQQEEEYPWKDKIRKAVWRGATTGEKEVFPNWRDLPRAKLVQQAVNHPTIMDAGFTVFLNRNEEEQREIIDSGFNGTRMQMKDYQNYMAIIDIDGNSWSSRFADLLCMNSVVIKVEPSWMDYFYMELQPWKHYVPVHANMSNLVEVVTMATSDDPEIQKQMQQIVHNANNWCRSKMTAPQLSIDMIWILIYYVEMLKKEDSHGAKFTRWKKSRWKTRDWIEIPFNASLKR